MSLFSWLLGEEKWRKAWERWNATAFHPFLVEKVENGEIWRTILPELSDPKGGLAVQLYLQHGHNGRINIVVHEMTKKLEPSKKNPFYASAARKKWISTGRRHIADVFRASEGYAVQSGSVFQKDKRPSIQGYLIAIIEEDTSHHIAKELSKFAYEANNWPHLVGNPRPE